MSKQTKRFYEFGEFRVDLQNRLLLRAGKTVPLKPKVFETLLLLVEHKGSVLSKDELIEKLWKDTVVEESNLTQNIYMLRKALGEAGGGGGISGASNPRYLETIPKRGYRFVAPVKEVYGEEEEPVTKTQTTFSNSDAAADKKTGALPDGEVFPGDTAVLPAASEIPPRSTKRVPAAALLAVILTVATAALVITWRSNKTPGPQAPPRAATATVKSIAVLPFNSLSPTSSPDDDFMGTGMADALITKLSNIKNLKVLPTSVVLNYPAQKSDPVAYGRELGVDSVLDGKIQRLGDSVRVTVQLARVSDGTILWAKQFDQNSADLFALQDSISEQVTEALTLRLSPEEQIQLRKRYTENAAAHEAYLKGRYFWNKRTIEGFKKAIEHFEHSIKIDPQYALAYAGLADCYMRLNDRGVPPSEGTVPRAKSAALRALEIDDSLAEAHATLGFINFRFEWDFAAAEREFKRSIELNPNYSIVHQWYAFYLLTADRRQEGFEEIGRARELDPLSLNIGAGLGTYFYFTGQYAQAVEQFRQTLEMEPGFAEARWLLGLAYEQQGMNEEAEREFKNLRATSDRGNAGVEAALAHLYATTGKPAEARLILNDFLRASNERYVSPYDIAVIYAGLGERDEALTWLEKAYAQQALRPAWLKFDPRLEGLRPDARFQSLLRRGGLNN